MKFTAAAAAAAVLAGVAAANPVPAPSQSKPFELILSSSDKSVDGKKIGACHAGAGIEAACVSDQGQTFFLNTTVNTLAPVPGNTAPGTLVYNLNTGDNTSIPSSLNLFGDAATNVQEAIFQPGDPQFTTSVTFSDKDVLGRISYLNDVVTPPNGTVPKVYNNWYACETYYISYTYQTLAWVVGNGSQQPQNPSCIKVDVTREFI